MVRGKSLIVVFSDLLTDPRAPVLQEACTTSATAATR